MNDWIDMEWNSKKILEAAKETQVKKRMPFTDG